MSDKKRNALNWFEIPSTDFQRAKKFYEQILSCQMQTKNLGGGDMAFLPRDEGTVGGAVVYHPEMRPSAEGTLVYLNADPDLAAVLERIPKAGGKVIVPKTHIAPDIGYFAMFVDSEGNRIALHSTN